MSFTFQSRELNCVIAIEDIHQLDLVDARRFHVELTVAIQGMDEAIMNAHRVETETGVQFDRDWMHKTRKKRRITIAFASETKRRLLKLEGIEGVDPEARRTAAEIQRAKFLALRGGKFRELLRLEFEPGELEQIEDEAHQAAEEQFKAWLAGNGHEQVYVP